MVKRSQESRAFWKSLTLEQQDMDSTVLVATQHGPFRMLRDTQWGLAP